MPPQRDFDGFISKRDSGDVFARALRSHLAEYSRVRTSLDSHLPGFDDSDHVQAALEAIQGSNFTIIIVGPERFEPVTESRDSYQMNEVMAAFRLHRDRKKSNRPHGIFIVHLIDEPNEEARDDLCEYLGQIKFGSRAFPHFYDAPLSADRSAAAWQAALDRVSHVVRIFMDSNNIPLVEEKPPRTAAVLSDATPLNLTGDETDYLDWNIGNWMKGQIDDVKRVPGDSDEVLVRRALFDFDPDRCILLDGQETKGQADESADHEGEDKAIPTAKRRPVFSTIFEDQTRPVLIVGPAGAGKTTTLTTSAALMAARMGEGYKNRASRLLETEIGTAIRSLPASGLRYMPVVIRCSTLSDRLKQTSEGAYEDFDTFIDLLIETVRGIQSPTSADRGAMLDRLDAQPYALFFDGLDEVLFYQRLKRIIDLVTHLFDRYRGREFDIKIMLSTRPKDIPGSSRLNIELMSLRMKEIDRYVEVFAASFKSAPPTKRKDVVSYAKDLFRNKDMLQEYLSLPFNLNCFCYLVWKTRLRQSDRRGPNTETEFFRMIVNSLIEDAACDGPTGEALPHGMLRTVLRRMAYDAIGESGKRQLGIKAAEKLCQHTLSSVAGYQSHDIEDEYAEIPPDYPTTLLDHIADHTEILYKTEENYVFSRVRFCEFLAGERLDADALTTTFLHGLDKAKLDNFLPSMKFCYALRLRRDVPEHANNVLKGLIDRAYDRLATDVEEAFEWLNGALDCFNSGFESDDLSELRRDPDNTGYALISDQASNMIADKADQLDPATRAETITKFLRLARRANPEQTIHHVRLLAGHLIQAPRRWVPFEIPDSGESVDGADRIMIERTPVLVCEFESFLRNQRRSLKLWRHAPPEERACIDSVSNAVSPDGETIPLESWRKQRRCPGTPVTFVNWYEAVAYARWLTEQTKDLEPNEVLRLPTVDELQAIAVGFSNGERFPWGATLREGVKSQANWRGAGIDGPSPPGTFPAQDGVVDLASNVRCWTIGRGEDGSPAWPPEKETVEKQSVIGGSWADAEVQFATTRPPEKISPTNRDLRFGIRLVRARLSD